MADYILTVDAYGNERKLENTDEFVLGVTNICRAKRGMIPEIPWLGINLEERQHIFISDTTKILSLQEEIYQQTSRMYPGENILVTIKVAYMTDNSPYLDIQITNTSRNVGVTVNYNSVKESYTIKYKDYNK